MSNIKQPFESTTKIINRILDEKIEPPSPNAEQYVKFQIRQKNSFAERIGIPDNTALASYLISVQENLRKLREEFDNHKKDTDEKIITLETKKRLLENKIRNLEHNNQY